MSMKPAKSISIRPAERIKRLPEQFFAGMMNTVKREIEQGRDIINLGQGNPDQPTPPHIVRAMQEAAENPEYHRYSHFRGHLFLKQAVAERYKQDYGVRLDPDKEVAILFGSKTGLVEICECLLNPGDTCLVPDPGYPDYWSGVALSGAVMETMPLLEANGFLPDYAALPAAAANRAKLMFFNYPNNPTSAVANASFYEDTVEFAAKYGIVAASDFAYGAIGFDGNRPISFLQTEGAKEVGVEFYTLSKTYNMAGWRVGFAVGNAEIIELINLIQDHYYCSLFGGIQAAAAAALLSSQECVEQTVRMYESRRNTLFAHLRQIGWEAKPSAGSFFTWLPVPKPYRSVEFADLLLREAGVMVAPGVGFGNCGEGFIRMGLLTSEERLEEAVRRIGKLNVF